MPHRCNHKLPSRLAGAPRAHHSADTAGVLDPADLYRVMAVMVIGFVGYILLDVLRVTIDKDARLREGKRPNGGSAGGFHGFSISERVQPVLLVTTVTLLHCRRAPEIQRYSWAPMMVQWVGGIDVVRIFHRINALVLTAVLLYHVGNAVYRLITN